MVSTVFSHQNRKELCTAANWRRGERKVSEVKVMPDKVSYCAFSYFLSCKKRTDWTCTVIRFVPIIAKFVICTVVGLNGTLVEAKIRTFKCPMSVFKLQQVFRLDPRRVQMPNLALREMKGITVCFEIWFNFPQRARTVEIEMFSPLVFMPCMMIFSAWRIAVVMVLSLFIMMRDVFCTAVWSWIFLCTMYIQHCFICRPSCFTVSEDAEIKSRYFFCNFGIGSQTL